MRDFRIVAELAVRHRAPLAFAALAMVAESAASLALPWAAGTLAQGVIAPAAGFATATILGAMLAIFALQAIGRFAAAYFSDGLVDRVVAEMRMRIYDRLQALPLAFHQERRLGDTLALLTHDIYVISGFVAGVLVAALPLVLTAAGAAIMMARTGGGLALAVIVLLPAFLFAFKVAGRRMRPLARELQDEEAGAVAMAHENLALLPAIKAYVAEERESARYGARIGRILALGTRQRRLHAALAPVAQFIAAAALVGILAAGASRVGAGTLTPGELVAFLLYAHLLTRPVAALADIYGQAQAARGALSRVRGLFEAPLERASRGRRELGAVRGEIVFAGVTFAYPGREPALRSLDLLVPAGEVVAVVGPNGAGKSTLAHLLLGFHAPSAGAITLDGVDVGEIELRSLRAHVGWVPQHVMLFNATIAENIAYGRPGADRGAIEAAARAAQAHDFIGGLPEGYETPVGDRGMRLSGGQQQRVALARALLKDPEVLVLDEATAMFDAEGEARFLAQLRRGGRTVLLVTHRPVTADAVDRIVHVRDGRVERIEPGRLPLRLVREG